jgi:hypothetical protein
MCCGWHILSFMVVNDLNVVGIALAERKANAPTRVYGHSPPCFVYFHKREENVEPVAFLDALGAPQQVSISASAAR